MQHKISDHNLIDQFETYLIQEEKSRATVEKYLRDVRCFFVFLSNRTVTKEVTVAYKKHLSEQYAPASVNSMLVALNVFLRFAGASDCCVKLMKIQRQIFCREDRADKKRISAAGESRRQHAAFLRHTDDLRNGNPGERVAVYYGRSCAQRKGVGNL